MIFAFCILNFMGCANASKPRTWGELDIKNESYISLTSLSQQFGLDWQWDPFSRVVTLSRNKHQMKLMVDSPIIIVDGVSKKLDYAPKSYQGAVVVSVEFEKEIQVLIK
ncbi:MAG: copper amine oxidase N-terminal domain-containing protein [Candidatus Omnitrophota bacterium]